MTPQSLVNEGLRLGWDIQHQPRSANYDREELKTAYWINT